MLAAEINLLSALRGELRSNVLGEEQELIFGEDSIFGLRCLMGDKLSDFSLGD